MASSAYKYSIAAIDGGKVRIKVANGAYQSVDFYKSTDGGTTFLQATAESYQDSNGDTIYRVPCAKDDIIKVVPTYFQIN